MSCGITFHSFCAIVKRWRPKILCGNTDKERKKSPMFDIVKRTALKWARVFNEAACGFVTSGHILNAVLTYQKLIHPQHLGIFIFGRIALSIKLY